MSTARDDTTGIRTYRGRSLEELIPRIRDELGPDAIILREREGLTGGVGGFFAQRCVEVDARAASPVDFYDEDFDAEPEEYETITPAPATAGPAAYGAAPAPVPALDPFAGPAPGHGEAASGRESAPMGSPYEAPPVPEPPVAEPPAPEAPAAPVAPAPQAVPAPAEYAAHPPTTSPLMEDEELSFSERLALARQERESRFAAQAPAPVEDAPPAVEEPSPAPAPAASIAAAGAAPPRTPAVALDRAAAGAVARELVGRGLSETWAHELIVSAGAHLAPFRGGSLREAVHACLASAITASPPLPAAGAAVAFVGSGGSGKTRCTAAMASAYRRASTLPVSVISLGADGRGGPDAEPLLSEQGIHVLSARGQEAAEAVARGRDGGLVVIDTRATSPVDTTGVAALAADLDPLALDAVLLAVPATLSASAARNLLDGLAALQPSALVITHADETDELGIAVELAYLSGLPIAFVHGGLTLEGALWPADPSRVAARLLP